MKRKTRWRVAAVFAVLVTVFLPAEGSSGDATLIFYPGGKVEDIAYAPLLKTLSDNGLTCILMKMPFNLAVFDIKAADSVYAQFPDVKNWYLGGHSLGGAMASSYVKDNADKLSGLILLGAYPVNDSDIATLAIYGTAAITREEQQAFAIDAILDFTSKKEG